MRFISSNIHGVLDYLYGILLIAMPWLMGMALGGPETWVPVTLGVAVIVYSLVTQYEWGVWPRMKLKAHLVLDVLTGLTLLVSVVFFGFYTQTTWWPYIAMGIVAVAGGLLTIKEPESRRPRFEAPKSLSGGGGLSGGEGY